jgi:hypothetical protein
MTTLTLERQPVAVKVAIKPRRLLVNLETAAVCPCRLPGIRGFFTDPPRNERGFACSAGYAIEWPDLDEHIGIDVLLAGRRSAESKKSLAR